MSSTLPFRIPLQREELTSRERGKKRREDNNEAGAGAGGVYTVLHNYSQRDLQTKISDCLASVRASGCGFVTQDGGFDVLFSVLTHFDSGLSGEFQRMALDIVIKATKDLAAKLDPLLEGAAGSDGIQDSPEWVNRLKMLTWLLCQLLEAFEMQEASVQAMGVGMPKARGKKGAKSALSTSGFNKEILDVDEKRNCVGLLYRLLNLNLAMLFDPPVVEEELVNLIGGCLFRLMETPSIALQRCKDLKMSMFQVLGVCISRMGYSLSCRLKIVQSLRHFEHLSAPMAEAVHFFVVDTNSPTMVMEVIREISEIDTQELTRDSAATRTIAAFLNDMTERLPEAMKACLSLLMVHLDGESSSLRKCVLSILGEILIKVLNEQDMDDASKEARDSFLDCLEDHIHDIHAHVRSSVLGIWNRLCSEKAIPLTRWQNLLKLTIGRLMDRSSNVRKQAIQLLTALLQRNPFQAQMPVDEFVQQLKSETVKLDALLGKQKVEEADWSEMIANEKKSDEGEEEMEEEDIGEDEESADVLVRLQTMLKEKKVLRARSLLVAARETFSKDEVFFAHADADTLLQTIYLTVAELTGEDEVLKGEITKQKAMNSFLSDCIGFANEMNHSLPTVALLLGSKVTTDVQEAIQFFVSAFEFGLMNALSGVRKMLALVWSKEASIKDAVVDAYRRLYINDQNTGKKCSAATIVRNFIALVDGATVGELTSLEELLFMLVDSKDFGKDCFQVLWHTFTQTGGVVEEAAAVSAMNLLGMVATSEPSIILSNMNLLIETGLVVEAPAENQTTEEATSHSLKLAYEVCSAIAKIVGAAKGANNETPALRFDSDHALFLSLEKLLFTALFSETNTFFVPFSQKACSVIFLLSEKPDATLERLIKHVCGDIPESGPSPTVLHRLVSLVGHVSLCQLNHLDQNVLGELKRRKALRDQEIEKSKDLRKVKAANNKRRKSMKSNADADDDMEVMGAEADDMEAEFIREVCEKKILTGSNLLTAFIPLITHICSNPTKYKNHPNLRASASLSLAKMMLLSSEFCEEHLQLLFTVLEKSPESVIRANLIIATGDLSFRFPNTLEPWTPNMYARLRDSSPQVKSNTLIVLTHLILNDMIKVKGQISDMALCVSEEDEKIAGLAQHFFTELARKGNALYNVMPDIISRLSDPSSGVTEERFKSIMMYIIGLIQKDKHLESLVEKLCHRFLGMEKERQWRDISFCLARFSFTDKAILKLADNYSCYYDKLHDDDVYNSLCSILMAAKKLPKNETKIAIEELENKLAEAREKCLEDHNTGTRAKDAKDGKTTKGKRKSVAAAKKGRKDETSEEEEEEEDEEEEEAEADKENEVEMEDRLQEEGDAANEEEQPEEDGGKRRGGRRKSAAAPAAATPAEEEGRRSKRRGGRESEDPPPVAESATKAPRGRGRKVIPPSDDEEEEEVEEERPKRRGRKSEPAVEPLAERSSRRKAGRNRNR